MSSVADLSADCTRGNEARNLVRLATQLGLALTFGSFASVFAQFSEFAAMTAPTSATALALRTPTPAPTISRGLPATSAHKNAVVTARATSIKGSSDGALDEPLRAADSANLGDRGNCERVGSLCHTLERTSWSVPGTQHLLPQVPGLTPVRLKLSRRSVSVQYSFK